MAKCKKCGKGGLFTKINSDGLCKDCAFDNLQTLYSDLLLKQESLGFTEYEQTMEAVSKLKDEILHLSEDKNKLEDENQSLNDDNIKIEKQLKTAQNKLSRSKELFKAIDYSIKNYNESTFDEKITKEQLDELEELSPSVILKLHNFDLKDLNKAFRDNDKQIEQVMQSYATRYTTKTNQTIYKLMVIALRAELQNILYNLKFEKLDNAISQVKEVTQKYMKIASDGNQNIAGTLSKFIGEIEYLFINAVKIEYNYYVKKEQAKQEQIAIREQMRQEAEERKALEAEKKKIEAEENKYKAEIEKAKEALKSANEDEKNSINKKIIELQSQLSDVIIKKDDIINLQNGKAGNIYIISNLGSFGENVFKVGMTRRLNPQDRVDELGSASVPFKFDVHSFIFSDDAVSLENKLHEILNSNRVNKVNMKKEFFYSSVDELEKIVEEIDPTAEFTKTMVAEEFRQSLSSNENYTSILNMDDNDDDDE